MLSSTAESKFVANSGRTPPPSSPGSAMGGNRGPSRDRRLGGGRCIRNSRNRPPERCFVSRQNDLGQPLTTNHHRRLRTRVGCPALRRCARRGLRHGIRVIGARPMESRERWRDAPSGALRLPVKVRSIDSAEEGRFEDWNEVVARVGPCRPLPTRRSVSHSAALGPDLIY